MTSGLAILAGDGQLPVQLHQAVPDALCVVFEGMAHQLNAKNIQICQFEKLNSLFELLKHHEISHVVMAGAMSRPQLDPAKFDAFMKNIARDFIKVLQKGDDTVLRYVITLFEDQGFIIDSKDLVSISREHDAVILVNPNSPTGVYSDAIKNIVLEINDTDFSSKCKFIWVDETYIDYVDESESLEGLVSDVDNLIICKSMSKCYALSGLRVAYIVSQKSNYLRKYIPPWSVSLPAQLAAISALNNPDYYQNKYHIIHFEREKFSQGLTEIGFKVFPGVANFLLTTLPIDSNYSSSSFITESRNLGLFVRDVENMGVTLTNKSVRFAIRSSEENNRMLSLVRKIIMKDQ